MPALRIINGFVTAPSTTLTSWTLATGDSLTVLNSPAPVFLLAAGGDWQTAGNLVIRSPRMHDNVRNLYLYGVASECYPLIYPPEHEYLVPQDTIIVQQSGSATAGDIESGWLLQFYYNLPGANGNFISYPTLMRNKVHALTVENTLALGTAGGYSGEEAITAEQDLMKANTFYALTGYLVSAECNSVGWRGPDTGNLRVGGPGNETNKDLTRTWFVDLARITGLPIIPVINSANKGATLIDGTQDENGADPLVTSIFVELAPTVYKQFGK